MIYHPRSVWQSPREPVSSASRLVLGLVNTVAVHYTADDDLIDGDPGESASDLPGYLRAIQRSYLTHRGYSLGYSWAIDWLGGVWELRGWDYRCAANAGHNEHTVALLMLVDGADYATELALSSAREMIAEVNRRTGRTCSIRGHCQLPAATACPGAGILSQLGAGVFDPSWTAPPPPIEVPPAPPIPPTPEENPDMNAAIIAVDGDPTRAEALLTIGGDGKVKLTGFDTPAQRDGLAKAGIRKALLSAEEYDAVRDLSRRP